MCIHVGIWCEKLKKYNILLSTNTANFTSAKNNIVELTYFVLYIND